MLSEWSPSYEDRVDLTPHTFMAVLIPPLLLNFLLGFLVLCEGSNSTRLALGFVCVCLAWRAGTTLDVARSFSNERMVWVNQAFTLAMTTVSLRSISWAAQSQPFKKPRPNSSTLKNAADLYFDLRGLNWEWSCNRMRSQPVERSSRGPFALSCFISSICHIFVFDLIHVYLQWLMPGTLSTEGASIFDDSLPIISRCARASGITFLSGVAIYCMIQFVYLQTATIALLIFRQVPSQWPPLFEAPWLSLSVTEFWNRRWHQLFRYLFLTFARLFPTRYRLSMVFTAFFTSGLLHTFGVWGMGNGAEFIYVSGFFILMVIPVALEKWWEETTGKKIGGFLGFIWTWTWLVGCGNLIVDAWTRTALIGGVFFPWMSEETRPAKIVFDSILGLLRLRNQ
ncbi:hypothetical protein DL96DRAFT_153016 [Flagelloscypha sp. PMI_526]|nr:hypothetical protein DL96DRAFT_153016 [Flagelloscypha sp. PMI_526]